MTANTGESSGEVAVVLISELSFLCDTDWENIVDEEKRTKT